MKKSLCSQLRFKLAWHIGFNNGEILSFLFTQSQKQVAMGLYRALMEHRLL